MLGYFCSAFTAGSVLQEHGFCRSLLASHALFQCEVCLDCSCIAALQPRKQEFLPGCVVMRLCSLCRCLCAAFLPSVPSASVAYAWISYACWWATHYSGMQAVMLLVVRFASTILHVLRGHGMAACVAVYRDCKCQSLRFPCHARQLYRQPLLCESHV